MIRPYLIQLPIEPHLRIALSPHPSGGNELQSELSRIVTDGYGHVVSLLETDEAIALGLGHEAEACATADLLFHHLPVRDGSIPGFARYVAFMEELDAALTDGRGLLIHCRHGIGRSSLVAVGLLLRRGMRYPEAVQLVADARGAVLPAMPVQGKLLRAYAGEITQR